MRLAEGGAVPAPHGAFAVGEFDVGAVWGDAEGGLDFGAEVLAHSLSSVAAHGADAFDLDVAGRVGGAAKGHGSAGLKGSHHVGFWFAKVLR